MTFSLPLMLALGATVSSSRLGVVAATDAATDAILAASPCPRAIVFPVQTDANAANQIQTYKASCPGGVAIAHVGDDGLAVNAAIAASVVPGWLALVPIGADAIEGPEVTGTATDMAAFWSAFADLAHQATPSLLPVVGSVTASAFAVSPDLFCETAAAMNAKAFSWSWSFHATSSLSMVITDAAFDFRRVQADCAAPIAGRVLLRVAPSAGSWAAGDATWLTFLDAELAADTTVQAGVLVPPVAPIQNAILAQLANGGADGGFPDGGADAGSNGGISTGSPGFGGPPGSGPKASCSTSGGAVAILGVLPVIFALRRRRGTPPSA